MLFTITHEGYVGLRKDLKKEFTAILPERRADAQYR